ncbi:MAG: 4Fe-4S dicluster domain-containing protein [Candidatus Eremiobacteraeota bacterium]|nr:4Fe-4S dicluster domain-containing protein [Candidatus Eremiobacteraeota bacterium]
MELFIDLEKCDRAFAGEVASMPGGEAVRRCFHCGCCAAGCPVREIEEAYNPRSIIRKIVLGLREEVLRSDFIWLCSACYNCQERCPQEVRITDLMVVLRNMAVKCGFIHPSFRKQVELLAGTGRLYEIEDFDNKKRKKSALPMLRKEFPEVRAILEKSGIMAMVFPKEAGKAEEGKKLPQEDERGPS